MRLILLGLALALNVQCSGCSPSAFVSPLMGLSARVQHVPSTLSSVAAGSLHRRGARIAAFRTSRAGAGAARMSGKDDEEFEVTWEHADGTTDVSKAIKMEDNPFDEKDVIRTGEQRSPLAKIAGSIKSFFGKAKMEKAQLAALGTSALLSYGFVSNISYVSCVICAWVVFGKQTGLSPLAAGQWPKFLAVYGGFWAFLNLVRPARFALSVGIAPVFEKFVTFVQKRASDITKKEIPKPAAFGIVVFLVNFVGTLSYLFFGLTLATSFAGVPLLAPKV